MLCFCRFTLANLWKVVCMAKKISKKNIKITLFLYDSACLMPFYARKCLFLHSKSHAGRPASRPKENIESYESDASRNQEPINH